jgi:hypothetical protein
LLADLVESVKVVGVDGLDKLGKGGLVLLGHLGDGQGGSGLLVNDGTEARLALNTPC